MAKLKNCTLGRYNSFHEYCEVYNSTFGDYVYVANNTKIQNATFSNFCSIGQEVLIGLGVHPTNMVTTFPAFYSQRGQCKKIFCEKQSFTEYNPVTIKNDVWIGARSIVLDGITIGDGAVIAAGSIVTKDVKPYSIVAGVPAIEKRKRFTKEQINYLQALKWWDKPDSWLKENSKLFLNIEKFTLKSFRTEA